MNKIGICSPKGFLAAGIHCGIRKNKTKKDLAMIYSEVPCNCAAVYTQNKVKGAPILITQNHLENGIAQAVIVNSGNANTCNADGEEKAIAMCELAGEVLSIKSSDVIVASTGVIGEVLDITPIQEHILELKKSLAESGSNDAAEAIMTTDTKKKEVSVSFYIEDKKVTIGGIAKGSGMIHPNMATMLCFLTTDVAMESKLLQKVISKVCDDTFNMVSVDGDTSTNDMASIMANGLANNSLITSESDLGYDQFVDGLSQIMTQLSKEIAGDGEGATKLLECIVDGAVDEKNAKIAAKSIITSSLVKSAMFGADANWGRILCAIGYSEADLDINGVKVVLSSKAGEILVCKNGAGVKFDEEKAKEILICDEIVIHVSLNDGESRAVAWGCDLTYDYVKINGDYRT